MATTTTNLGLTKPAYSDTADIAVINTNMDKLDTAVNATEKGLAIIADGNTHAAIASGQFVYVRGHGTLSEGLYRATAAIATNGTLSSSNLTSASSGGLNALNSDVANLSDHIANNAHTSKIALTMNSNYVNGKGTAVKFGDMVMVMFTVKLTAVLGYNTPFAYVPSGYRPLSSIYPMIIEYVNASNDLNIYDEYMTINTSGEIIQSFSSAIGIGSVLRATFIYAVA